VCRVDINCRADLLEQHKKGLPSGFLFAVVQKGIAMRFSVQYFHPASLWCTALSKTVTLFTDMVKASQDAIVRMKTHGVITIRSVTLDVLD
jgi:hypothetical protein